MSAIFLQIFLLVDVFAAGALVTLAVQQAYAHRHRHTAETPATTTAPEILPSKMREQLLQQSKQTFEKAVGDSAAQLERDLGVTASLLDKLVKRLGAEIVSSELERYRTELTGLREQVSRDMAVAKEQLQTHRPELEAQLLQELEALKQQRIKQIDTRLGDAVASFLTEAMQHQIDLGAQEPYLKQLLETHKADFVKAVDDGQAA